jgi:hypothetical protein
MTYKIATPGRLWIAAAKNVAKTDTGNDEAVSGFYIRKQGGITFFDLAGNPFACLITNRHRERFFVSCSMTSEGIRYLHSTMTCDEVKLGIDQLGYGDTNRLAQSIVEDMDQQVAAIALTRAGLTVEHIANAANNLTVSDADRLAMDRAGLIEAMGDETYLKPDGRIMLMRSGYADSATGWKKEVAAEQIAA